MLARLPTYGLKRVILWQKYKVKSGQYGVLTMGWKIHHMDVKTKFLNGVFEEEVYIENLEGFETFNRESHV